MKHVLPTARPAAALLACCGALTAVPSTAAPADLQADARLKRHIAVRCDGECVSALLAELGRRCGVQLETADRTRDERLVAYVPDAPLRDVMENVAALYRCEWTAVQKDERLTYRLSKPERTRRAEDNLRAETLRKLIADLMEQLKSGPKVRPAQPPFRAILPDLAPVAESLLPALQRDGYAALQVGDLPIPLRTRIAGSIQQGLDSHRAFTEELNNKIKANTAPGLPHLAAKVEDARAEECSLIFQLDTGDEPELLLSLRTPGGTLFRLVATDQLALSTAGVRLYESDTAPDGKSPQPEIGAAALPKGATLQKQLDDANGDWPVRLRLLSDAAHRSIYADCYSYHALGAYSHPRSASLHVGGRSLEEMIAELCQQPLKRNQDGKHQNSFWWKRGDAILIRSSRYLWDEEGVLPRPTVDQLAGGMRTGRKLRGTDVQTLGGLNLYQVQTLGFTRNQISAWIHGVKLPSTMSLGTREALADGAITYERLLPAERLLVRHTFRVEDGDIPYRATLKTRISNVPPQGGTMLILESAAFTPIGEGALFLYLPLPGYSADTALKPIEPKVRVLGDG